MTDNSSNPRHFLPNFDLAGEVWRFCAAELPSGSSTRASADVLLKELVEEAIERLESSFRPTKRACWLELLRDVSEKNFAGTTVHMRCPSYRTFCRWAGASKAIGKLAAGSVPRPGSGLLRTGDRRGLRAASLPAPPDPDRG